MDERIVKILSTEGFHRNPEDTFRRRVERFPLDVQQEVATRAVDLLFIEGDASDGELQLMDDARAFVNARRAEADDSVIWQLGQLIQRRAYHPGNLSTPALELWHFLANYDYPDRRDEVEDALEELGEPSDSSSKAGTDASEGSGFWGKIWDAITD